MIRRSRADLSGELTQPSYRLAGTRSTNARSMSRASSARVRGAARAGERHVERLRFAGMESGAPRTVRPVDVIIADDHTVVRDGIRAVLQREAVEVRFVAEAADVPTMIREVRVHKSDLLSLCLTYTGSTR